jgi:hypothetical protein
MPESFKMQQLVIGVQIGDKASRRSGTKAVKYSRGARFLPDQQQPCKPS